MNIPLGYEVETGRRVSIPLNHSAVIGQTQLSGKTTTLERMAIASGMKCVSFITKPGEKSFRLQTQIPAFFSESTIEEYWKHVVAILEYRSDSKLGWRERGVIIKLCQDYKKETSRVGMPNEKGKSKREALRYGWLAPKSLRGLLENIEAYIPYARGAEEMICIQLREYLRPAIKEIEATEFSDKLRLSAGINVMDVTELTDGLKSLVIRSVIEWVHKHGRKIVVIIPEAWKFIPEGRTTPVKLALEGLIREGAGVGNFVWLDSQDLRGVDKMLLRSVIVWLFGVQRQKNEVASTLGSIPDHPRPSATEIMQLGKGQFYVCYGTTLKLTYVQPAGMEDAHAQAIARGEESPDSWRQIVRALDKDKRSDESTEIETEEVLQDVSETETADAAAADRDAGAERLDLGTKNVADLKSAVERRCDNPHAGPVRLDEALITGDDEKMWKEKYEALAEEHRKLIETHDAMAEQIGLMREEIKTLKAAVNNEFEIPSHENESDRLDADTRTAAPRAGRSDSGPGADRLSPSAPELNGTREEIKVTK